MNGPLKEQTIELISVSSAILTLVDVHFYIIGNAAKDNRL